MKRTGRIPNLARRLTLLGALHLAAGPLLKQAGFRWQVRRQGDLKIGLWRKRLSTGRAGSRRFVLLPGFGDTPLSWLAVVSALIPSSRGLVDEIVLVDFPGFQGFLSNERAFPSMDLLIEASHDLLDSLAPETVFGHSLGAWLTASYAARCGSEARPRARVSGYRGPKRVILANPSGVFGNESQVDEWSSRFARAKEDGFAAYRPHLFASEPFWFRWIAPAFGGFFGRNDIRDFLGSVRTEHLLNGALASRRCEAWLLWGDRDSLVPPNWVAHWIEELGAAAGPARAVLLRNVGHSPHLERPFVTAAIVSNLLRSRWNRGIPASSPLRLFCREGA